MNVQMYKLVSGEIIVTEIKETNPDNVYVELVNPRTLVLQRTEEGVQVGLAPFMPLGSEVVTLFLSGIVATTSPDAALVEEYRKQFSDIILPKYN